MRSSTASGPMPMVLGRSANTIGYFFKGFGSCRINLSRYNETFYPTEMFSEGPS